MNSWRFFELGWAKRLAAPPSSRTVIMPAWGLDELRRFFRGVGTMAGLSFGRPPLGLLITVAILRLVWESGRAVFTRLLDGIDPEVIEEITHAIKPIHGVHDVTEVRLRWSGHRLHAEINISVSPELSVEKGHEIAVEAQASTVASVYPIFRTSPFISTPSISREKNTIASWSTRTKAWPSIRIDSHSGFFLTIVLHHGLYLTPTAFLHLFSYGNET